VDKIPDHSKVPPKETLTAYIRKWFGLQFGNRCGMCGCRFRHDIYWSLGMRVCKLCVAAHSVSAYHMEQEYGLNYVEVAAGARNRIFYYSLAAGPTEDRVAVHAAHPSHVQRKVTSYMFWLPHLKAHHDLPALKLLQGERRRAAAVLAGAVRRRWLQGVRAGLALRSRCSIDCFLVAAYRNERRLLSAPYKRPGMEGRAMGIEWAFPESRSRTRLPESLIGRLCANEDSCVVV
jgi:hypothetical protein